MSEKIAMWRSMMVENPKFKDSVKRFWGHNWKPIVKLLILILLVLVPCLVVKHKTTVKLRQEYEAKIAEVRAETEQATIDRLAVQYGTLEDNAERAVIDDESKVLAKMLYAYKNNSDEGMKSACWCALNRVDSKYYPDTVQGVCEQKSQWMGWSDENPVLQKLFDIAHEQVALWHNGIHLVDPDFVYLEWTPKEITLRTEFSGKGHFWYESDWAKQA